MLGRRRAHDGEVGLPGVEGVVRIVEGGGRHRTRADVAAHPGHPLAVPVDRSDDVDTGVGERQAQLVAHVHVVEPDPDDPEHLPAPLPVARLSDTLAAQM